jgi:hypothetical protein
MLLGAEQSNREDHFETQFDCVDHISGDNHKSHQDHEPASRQVVRPWRGRTSFLGFTKKQCLVFQDSNLEQGQQQGATNANYFFVMMRRLIDSCFSASLYPPKILLPFIRVEEPP